MPLYVIKIMSTFLAKTPQDSEREKSTGCIGWTAKTHLIKED
jgi:hypothetical protein